MNAPQKVGIGTPISRVDGVAKVTGEAKYAAEYRVSDMLYGVAVVSAIAKGRIVSIDEEAARAVPGVVDIVSHLNRPRHAWLNRSWKDKLKIPGEPFKAFHDDKIMFNAQPIAVVVAETFEAARFAASLVEVAYEAEPHNIDFGTSLTEKFYPKPGSRRDNFHPPKNHGMPRAPSPTRRFSMRPSTTMASSTTCRWKCTPPPFTGTATAPSRSTTRSKDR